MAAFREHTDDFEVIYASKAFSVGGDRPAGARGGPLHRRVLRRRVPRGQGGRLPAGADLLPRQQQDAGPSWSTPWPAASVSWWSTASRSWRCWTSWWGRGASGRRILLRITPGIEAHTHSYIQTGQVDSKFGFGLADGVALEAIRQAMAAPHLDLVGPARPHRQPDLPAGRLPQGHRHPGGPHRAGPRRLRFRVPLPERRRRPGHPLHRGRHARRPSASTRPSRWRACGRRWRAWGLPMPRVLIEPGRSIVGKAGSHRLHAWAPSRRSRASAPT